MRVTFSYQEFFPFLVFPFLCGKNVSFPDFFMPSPASNNSSLFFLGQYGGIFSSTRIWTPSFSLKVTKPLFRPTTEAWSHFFFPVKLPPGLSHYSIFFTILDRGVSSPRREFPFSSASAASLPFFSVARLFCTNTHIFGYLPLCFHPEAYSPFSLLLFPERDRLSPLVEILSVRPSPFHGGRSLRASFFFSVGGFVSVFSVDYGAFFSPPNHCTPASFSDEFPCPERHTNRVGRVFPPFPLPEERALSFFFKRSGNQRLCEPCFFFFSSIFSVVFEKGWFPSW